MVLLSNQNKGELYAISSGFCYGFVGYFGMTIINSGISVFNMLFWRFFISALLMLIILLPKYKMIFQSGEDNLKVIFCGMAFYGASTTIYFIASKYIGSGLAMVILFTYPAIVMLFNVLYHKLHISKSYYIAFLLLIIGLVCLIDMHVLIGISLGLASSFFYACYIIASKKISIPPTVSTFMVSIGCMTTCLISSIIDSSFSIPESIEVWCNIISISMICTALPILLLLEGLKYISSEKASLLSVLEPVFVLILGIALLNEQVTRIQIIGSIMLLLAAIITLLSDKNEANQ